MIRGMTPASSGATEPRPLNTAPGDVWVRRTGTRTYTGHNGRGGRVAIGPGELGGAFTPGELLKVALAGCGGMTADHGLARRLGEDFALTIRVSAAKPADDDRYESFAQDFELDLSGLSDQERQTLEKVFHRAIEEHCTVSKTVESGATVDLRIIPPQLEAGRVAS